MDEPRVVTEIDGSVAHVWLNRPDKLNGVDLEMLEGLLAAAKALRADRDVRAVVLQGRGPSFCSGLDFANALRSRRRVARFFVPAPFRATNLFQRAVWAWRELPVPVVAVTRGHVYGAGLQLALAADFRFTTPDCRWAVLEAKWGLVPDMSGSVTLGELVPPDLAKRLTMTGEVFTGEQAHAWGLATEVGADPLAAALDLVAQLSARSPDSVAASKRLLDRTRHSRPRRALRLERRHQLAMFRALNTKIARKAAAAGQDPEFGPRRFD